MVGLGSLRAPMQRDPDFIGFTAVSLLTSKSTEQLTSFVLPASAVCLIGGALYQESPPRSPVVKYEHVKFSAESAELGSCRAPMEVHGRDKDKESQV